jgi:hypothetical protein
MEKYEKIEFDMNTIDSAFMKTSFQRGWNYFDHIDTSEFTENLFANIYK